MATWGGSGGPGPHGAWLGNGTRLTAGTSDYFVAAELEDLHPVFLVGSGSDHTGSCRPQPHGLEAKSGQDWACLPSAIPAKERTDLAGANLGEK